MDIQAADYDHDDSTDIAVVCNRLASTVRNVSHTLSQYVDHKDCHIQETNHKCIGQLYVRMANMVTGKKSSSQYGHLAIVL